MPQILARILPCLACLLVLSATAAPIRVEKPAREKNPTLVIAEFTGDKAVRQILRDALHYSDWFTVVDTKDADYRLHASYVAGADQHLVLDLRDPEDNRVVGLRQPGPGAAQTVLVHTAVDALIMGVFQNPGWCRTRLAYVRRQGETKEIWLSDFAGGNAEQLTHNTRISTEPQWGPGQEYLVYTLYHRFTQEVILANVPAERQRRLSSFSGLNANAALSPDRQYLAVCLSKDDQVDLYRLHLPSGELDRLTNSRALEASPTWSPDGKTICFVSDERATRPTLFTVPAAGGKPERLLSLPGEAVSPDWSAVSGRIVFALRQGDNYSIAVVDPRDAAAGLEVIVKAAGDWEAPSWAADGRHIVCTRSYLGDQGLYVVDSWYGRQLPLPQRQHVSLPSCSGHLR